MESNGEDMHADEKQEALFSALLTPHRSMGPKAFMIVMILISFFSFVAGMYFVTLGAWPVLGFFGLDVLAIYFAFKMNFRAGEMHEIITLKENQLEIKRVFPNGKQEKWSCNPYWAKLHLKERHGRTPELSISSQGRSFIFGEFLIPDEKEEFVGVLNGALRACQ